jgi:hypothetical protein
LSVAGGREEEEEGEVGSVGRIVGMNRRESKIVPRWKGKQGTIRQR